MLYRLRRLPCFLTAALLSSLTTLPSHTADPTTALARAMAEAEQGLRSQEIQLAESRYRTALFEGWTLLGALAVADNRPEDARQAFEQATTVAVETRRAFTSLALVHLELGDAPAAIEILRDLLARRPRDVAARKLLAQALIAAGEPAEAVRELAEAYAASEDPELAFALATGHLRLGNMEAADALFERLVHDRPIPQTWVLIGRTWRDFRAYERARAALEKALELDPTVQRAHYYLGSLELRSEGRARLEEAIIHFREELQRSPEDRITQLYLGLALVEGRRFEEALVPLETASRQAAANSDIFHYLGRCYLGLDRPKDAATALERALELAADSPPEQLTSIHYQLALALRRLGEPAAAEHFAAAEQASANLAETSREQLNRYLRDEPEEAGTIQRARAQLEVAALTGLSPAGRQQLEEQIEQHLARAYLNLGIMQTQAQHFVRASELLVTAARVAPDFPQVQYSLGVAHFNAGQFAQATPPLQRAFEKQPENTQLGRMLALARMNSGDYPGAATLLAADEGRSGDPSLQYAYGLSLVRSGQASAAQPVFDQLLAHHAAWPELHVLLGQAHAQEGNFQAAIGALQHALELKADVADAHATLGDIYLRQGDLSAAENVLRGALEAQPEDQRARYLLATVLDLNRQPEEAQTLLRPLLRAAPDHADARYLLGKILLASGAISDAVAQLEAAVRFAPEDPNIHYQLAQAYQKQGDREKARERFASFRELKDKQRRGEP